MGLANNGQLGIFDPSKPLDPNATNGANPNTLIRGNFGLGGDAPDAVELSQIANLTGQAREDAIAQIRALSPGTRIPGVDPPEGPLGGAGGTAGGQVQPGAYAPLGGTASSNPGAINAQIAAEGQRDLERGNFIGDAFANTGVAANQVLQAQANDQQARGNLIGDAMQNRGTAAAAAMGNLSLNAQRTGSNYAEQGQASNAQQNLDRLQQIGIGGAAYNAGMANMQASDMYGAQAVGAAGQLAGTQQTQMGIGNTAGQMGTTDRANASMLINAARANQAAQGGIQAGLGQQAGALGAQAGQNFGQAMGYGAQGQGDYAAQQMARMQQIANGQQGAAYGAGNMQTAGGFLGQAGRDYGAQAGSRADQMGAVNRLQGFYQQGPGPSAAEAQLKQSTDQNMANAISLARSGRGAGDNASAMRQAMFSNAATQQQAGMQAAQLRAQEADAWRGKQLQAMGQEQSTLGNMRGQDQGMYGQNIGAAGQFAGLGYQGLGLGQQGATSARQGDLSAMGQNQSAQQGLMGLGYQGAGLQQQGMTTAGSQNLQQQGMNLGAAGQFEGLSYQGQGLQAQQANTVAGQQLAQQQAYLQQQQQMGALGYQGYGLGAQQANQSRAMDLSAMNEQNQMGLGYNQLGQSYQQLGQQTQLGYSGLANQQYTSSDQLAAQERNAAQQTQLQYMGLANDQYQTADQLRNQQMLAQLSSDTSRYGADKNISIAQAQMAAQKQAAQLSAGATMIGGVMNMMSDIRAKEDIKPEEQFFTVNGETRKKRKPKGGLESIFGLKDEGFANAEEKNYVPLEDEDKPSLLRQLAARNRPADTTGPGMTPWEMGVSPFATQAPPESPYIEPEPIRPYQPRTVNLDFDRFPRSDERSKKNKSAYVTSDERSKQGAYAMGATDGHQNAQQGLPPPPTPPASALPQPQPQGSTNASAMGQQQGQAFQSAASSGGPSSMGQAMQQAYGAPTRPPAFSQGAPSAGSLGQSLFGQQGGAGAGTDLRPAQGYSYQYKDPSSPGAAPGRHFGPMAQDLEQTPAGASVVHTGEDGMKSIDTNRLSLVNTSAISEQQRRLDRLEQIAGRR